MFVNVSDHMWPLIFNPDQMLKTLEALLVSVQLNSFLISLLDIVGNLLVINFGVLRITSCEVILA
jgi:hypothetical protein